MRTIRYIVDLQGAQSESRFRGIGRYSLELARAMAQTAGDHEMWVALSSAFLSTIESVRSAFDGLLPQDRIVTFDVPTPVAEFDPANHWRRSSSERIRERFLAAMKPDVVHTASMFEGYVDDAVTSIGAFEAFGSTAVTMYDLIPLLSPQQYLVTPPIQQHYLRKVQWVKRADLLLAISESSRRGAIEALGIPAEQVANISTGVDAKFRQVRLSDEQRSELFNRYGIRRGFVLYSGSFDSRKNIEGLISAFALLEPGMRAAHQLVIAGKHDPSARERLQELGNRLGLRGDTLLFPGYVDDNDLVALYNQCSLFVMPSFHEGFGLPALEAMACGAPTIVSNLTSLPEVVANDDALFDPHRPASIAQKMQQVLSNKAFCEALREHGLRQCREFTWQRSATRAWSALEELHERRKSTTPTAAPKKLPRMAFFSALPPEASGIADYSAELLPELARFYDIEVIVQQPEITDGWIKANFPVRDSDYFERRASKFDRILYHVGNSPFHLYMFDLMRRYPGVVVLHDFFQTAVLNWMDRDAGISGHLLRAVYESHSFTGLQAAAEHDRDWIIRHLPCNLGVIQAALGVIVHSQYSRQLAHRWYGENTASGWRIVAFPKNQFAGNRKESRARLGILPDEYLVCSFGMLDPTKLNDRLLSTWLASGLVANKQCRLLFVGQNHGGEWGRVLGGKIRDSRFGDRVRITGFAQPEEYRDYLFAADCAVQLRTMSRGETSAAIFDCLSHGLPTILNAHGSAAELSPHIAYKLPDDFSDRELSSALERLQDEPEFRTNLGRQAAEFVRQEHNPRHVAEQYRDAIEEFQSSSPMVAEQRLLRSLADMDAAVAPTHRDLAVTASCIARQRWQLPPQLLLDVSATAKHNLKSGIERVARNATLELMRDSGDVRIEPIRCKDTQWLYARKFGVDLLGVALDLPESALEFRAGDIYLALDWSPETVCASREFYQLLRAHHVPIHFLVYDLLPLLLPKMFPDWAVESYRSWLETICEIADGLICDSRSVADELITWLDANPPRRARPLNISYFHVGADILVGPRRDRVGAADSALISALAGRPTLLMVGTIEPRKGHALALDALERLWDDGVDANLVIVGRKGWNVEALEERMRKHPEQGKRLHWPPNVSDETLVELYRVSSALLAASEGEGFGLPLVEAARHRLPIIARDIPVFREVAGEHALYFEGGSAESLARSIRRWLELHSQGAAPSSAEMKWLTWQESAAQLRDAIEGRRVYRQWNPNSVRARSAAQEVPAERL